MHRAAYGLLCLRCAARYDSDYDLLMCRKCDGELTVVWDLEGAKETFVKSDRVTGGVWGYQELLPVSGTGSRVTLSEGGTPLIRCRSLGEVLGVHNLYIKDETRNPSGSFKDRGITVGISKAKERGVTDVVCASTGNLAASVASYSARGCINAHIFLPEATPKSKIVQTLAYGAKVHLVPGRTTDDASVEALKACKKFGWFPMRSNPKWNPYPMEGTKTIAFEIAEQLNWEMPDFVLTGVGSGTNIAGNWKGFKELFEIGLVSEKPGLVGVQASGCMPFVDAIRRNLEEREVRPWPNPQTIASGLADALPPTCLQALDAVRESRGTAVDVGDDELVKASLDLARREGVFAEPSAAASIAALRRLREDHGIDASDTVVCEVTGTGFKQMTEIARAVEGSLSTDGNP